MSPTRHWSQADCLSRIVLSHAPRQATVRLTADVRQKIKYMKLRYPEQVFYRKPLPDASIDELLSVEWFASVRDPSTASAALSPEWEDLTLERRNELSGLVAVKLQHRGSEWNKCARAFRLFFDENLAPIVSERLVAARLSPDLLKCVAWDIVSYMQELNYSDIRRLGFYGDLWHAYRRGEFPCGWSGAYPNGTVITA